MRAREAGGGASHFDSSPFLLSILHPSIHPPRSCESPDRWLNHLFSFWRGRAKSCLPRSHVEGCGRLAAL